MSYQSNYIRGNWKAICESCGRIVKATELRQRWDGFMVDNRCWEPRQPQDFVRGIADYQAPPFTRPEQQDVFVPVTYIMGYDGQTFIRPVQLSNSVMMLVSRIIGKPILSAIQTSVTSLVALYLKKPRAINTYSINNNTIG